MALAPSAYADDYYFDMSKARQTFGNGTGTTYSDTTRLDNERRDKDKFNPLWLTEESTIEMEFVSEGEYEETPAVLVLQSWTGELVSGTEEKWIHVLPSSYTETTAIFTYDDIVATYGADFSDIYAINVADSGNALLIKSMVATNVNVPEDEITDKLVGTLVKEGELPPWETEEQTELETTVADPADVPEDTTTEAVSEESANSETAIEGAEQTNTDSLPVSASETETIESEPAAQDNTMMLIILVSVGVLSVITIIIAIIAIKKKGRNYHRFK